MDVKTFDEGKHKSYWIETTPQLEILSQPSPDQIYDVIVIGAGIAGLTTAYLLNRAGKNVLVIDRDSVAEGVTGYTTAKVTSLHTLIYDYLIRTFGFEKAKMYAESQQKAIETIATIIERHNIKCDFVRTSAFTYTEESENIEQIQREVDAAKRLRLPADYVVDTELPYQIEGGIEFRNQAHFHPRKYLLAMAQTFLKFGGLIKENTTVYGFNEGNPCFVRTSNGVFKSHDVVVAMHYPLLSTGLYFTRLYPMRSYVISAYVSEPETVSGMYINTDEPLFSIRPQPTETGRMLIFTGLEHKTGHEENTKSCYQKLYDMIRKRFKIEKLSYYWSTQDNFTPDNVPYIGRMIPSSKHIYLTAGFGGWGMTNGTVSGMLLSDMILERDNPWVDLYNPMRIGQIKGIGKFVGQNFDVGVDFLGGRARRFPQITPNTVAPGNGEVIEYGKKKKAIYKDDTGKIHAVSPICTHLGCIVAYNNAEKSWDCPCHGSRFNIDGKVIQGPATSDLQEENTEPISPSIPPQKPSSTP